MAARERSISEDLLDRAERLLDELDNLAELLTEIEIRHGPQDADPTSDLRDETHEMSNKLKTGINSAQDLIVCLKREKWRLSKRELSLDCRLGELEDYKHHLKEDMSSMNVTVEELSLRLVQVENELCEAQESQETLQADNFDLKSKLRAAEHHNKELLKENEQIAQGVLKKPLGRSESNPITENISLKDTVAILNEENKRLKVMLQDAERSELRKAFMQTKITCNGSEENNNSATPLEKY